MRLRVPLPPRWIPTGEEGRWRADDHGGIVTVSRLVSSAAPIDQAGEPIELATGWRGWLRRGDRDLRVEVALTLGLCCHVTLEVSEPAALPAAERELRDALAQASPDWQADGEVRCLADLLVG